MSEFDKKYRDGTIQSFVSNQPTRNRYGTILDVDKLVDSRKVSDRVNAVQMGYGLDILMDDPSPKVQKALLDFMKLTNKSKIK